MNICVDNDIENLKQCGISKMRILLKWLGFYNKWLHIDKVKLFRKYTCGSQKPSTQIDCSRLCAHLKPMYKFR